MIAVDDISGSKSARHAFDVSCLHFRLLGTSTALPCSPSYATRELSLCSRPTQAVSKDRRARVDYDETWQDTRKTTPCTTVLNRSRHRSPQYPSFPVRYHRHRRCERLVTARRDRPCSSRVHENDDQRSGQCKPATKRSSLKHSSTR